MKKDRTWELDIPCWLLDIEEEEKNE